ncbi:Potassium channel subfamily K member 13 Tandem pore domain halothane-inhibited potassium channel 1 [Channa argus]|uniref:Potassium channel subfamily K member 13 Tandem pore domain halothane-inhibited potassium channel 1 n=1 Tax=Channa argus TaxID=215402 RepID=A0A6G1QJQ7_CHAAH|nr:Potassium channel subfamily K member 13 Tandem pore domain halothane-inhibited potassium channel 1 [Channa argus]
MACRSGCSPINEDNARFLLLALFIIIYLLCGAAVFSALEQPKEREAKERWAQRFEHFSQKYNLSKKDLNNFLRNYEEANVAGIRVDTIRPRWDFTGAFYFVGTVVSTIGFGMTTPATIGGKVFLMFYGLLGCAATILFFNLFLERVITVIALVLKSCHERRHNKVVLPQNGRRVSDGNRASGAAAGEGGKVYCVMLILGAAAILVSCCASFMYSAAEGWSYLDSLYFCFVAFSTIGFGDMVSSQRVVYEGHATVAYRVGNFFFILTGVCCIYSLFNVISIVIKQVLNWLLRRLEAPCRCCFPRKAHHPHRHPRRNVVAPGHLRARRDPSIETDAINESETDPGRRMSGEMISMRDFLAANKVNLAIMQKQLSEMAIGHPRQCSSSSHQNGFSGGVGALGIMNNRLAETSMDR